MSTNSVLIKVRARSMIRMSKETDYGIVVLAYFASVQEGLKHNAREVAMESQLPLPMVRKILKILAREGLLVSHRGVKGGYSLARRGGRISSKPRVSVDTSPFVDFGRAGKELMRSSSRPWTE
jgi:predicted methyltransferase